MNICLPLVLKYKIMNGCKFSPSLSPWVWFGIGHYTRITDHMPQTWFEIQSLSLWLLQSAPNAHEIQFSNFTFFVSEVTRLQKKALKFMKKSNFLAAPSARGLWYVVKIYSSILKIPGCATDTFYIRGNKFNRQRWDITFALVPWKDGWIFWSNGSQGVNNLYKRDATCVCLSEF